MPSGSDYSTTLLELLLAGDNDCYVIVLLGLVLWNLGLLGVESIVTYLIMNRGLCKPILSIQITNKH